tara:strand:- start:7919 stop:9568 length:1650 start_codon:yes stop_codon:yes gene_type:complete
MAKIVPKGYADIGAYNEMDDYTQIMDFLRNVSQDVRIAKQQEEVSDINAMNTLYKTIDDYTTPADLDRLDRLRKSIVPEDKVFDNQEGNILNETLDFAISKKKINYQGVRTQASKLATELMSSNNVLGTPLYELTEADLVRSINDNISKENKEGGYLASIAERRMEAAGFNSLITNFIGKDGYGRMKTIPSMSIPYTRQDGTEGTMSLAELVKRQTRHDEVLKGVVSGAAIDGIISPEQASVIVSLTGEEGFDIDSFIKTGNSQRKILSDELKYRRGSNKDAITKLSQILKSYKEDSANEYQANLENEFKSNQDFQNVNPVALTGDPEKDTEEFFNQLQSGSIDKGLFTVMLNDLIAQNNKGINRAIRGLEAWDVKSIYGKVKETSKDIKKSTQDIDLSDLNLENFVDVSEDVMSDKELLQANQPIKIADYDKLSKTEKAKIEQLRKQAIKENPRLQGDGGIDSTEKFYNLINSSNEMPELKGLNKFISFFKAPVDKAFTGKPYKELSEKHKKRIAQYKMSVGNVNLTKLPDSKFYKTLSKQELDKILK